MNIIYGDDNFIITNESIGNVTNFGMMSYSR